MRDMDVFFNNRAVLLLELLLTMIGVMVISSGREYCSVKVFALSSWPLVWFLWLLRSVIVMGGGVSGGDEAEGRGRICLATTTR